MLNKQSVNTLSATILSFSCVTLFHLTITFLLVQTKVSLEVSSEVNLFLEENSQKSDARKDNSDLPYVLQSVGVGLNDYLSRGCVERTNEAGCSMFICLAT